MDALEVGETKEDAIQKINNDLSNPELVQSYVEQLTEWLEELEDNEQKQVCRQLIDEMTPFLSIEEVPHYTVELTSDAFADPFIIRDNTVPYGEDGQYYDVDGIYQTFETEEEAQEYADTLNSAENIVKLFAQKDEERSQQEQPDKQDNADLIGKEIVMDNRRYVIENISEISGDVSMRDMTFADAVGFPINRVEKSVISAACLVRHRKKNSPIRRYLPPLPPQSHGTITALPRTLWASAAQKKSSAIIWRLSISCTNWSLKTDLPRLKNRKPFQSMSVGAVCLWRLMNTIRRGLMSSKSCMQASHQKNTVRQWSLP